MINTYNTKDLALAAFLLTMGYELLRADKDDPVNVIFYFQQIEQLPALETAVTGYMNGQGIVEPKIYYRNTKLLKTVIHGGYKPGRVSSISTQK